MPSEPVARLAGCCTRPECRIQNLDWLLRSDTTQYQRFSCHQFQGNTQAKILLAGQVIFRIYSVRNQGEVLRDEASDTVVGAAFCIRETVKGCPEQPPTRDQLMKANWPEDYTKVLMLMDKVMRKQTVHSCSHIVQF
jgi:hypothetical protein